MGWSGGFVQWREAFLALLDSNDLTGKQLLRWMEGHDLPAEDVLAEPHYWLVRAIMDNRRAHWASILAARAASVLNNGPELFLPTRSSDRILANLLALCASLARPMELSEALDSFAGKNDLSTRKNDGVPIAFTLRVALTFNQSDDRLFSKYWVPMIDKAASPRLPGDAYDGLDGVLLMRGNDFYEIGWALGQIARQIQRSHSAQDERDAEFKKVLARVYLRRPELDEFELFSAGRQANWPTWAYNLLTCTMLRH